MHIPSTWRAQSFSYTDSQLDDIERAIVVMSALSLACSLAVAVFYAFFLYYERRKTDRVSLRCVALATVVNVADSALGIVSGVRSDTPVYCRGIGFVIDFTDVFNACLLSIIGINLVLIFVIQIKFHERLEWFYYPGAFVYSVAAMIFPIVQETEHISSEHQRFNCW